MLLVDALYICYGGALGLLRYLVRGLEERGADFFLLYDARCGDEFMRLPHVEKRAATLKNRKAFYQEHGGAFSSVFCFGNIPPPYKLNVPVYTYFHNINMLTLADSRDWKQYLQLWMKRTYIKRLKRHTDCWFVQTENTEKQLRKYFAEPQGRVERFPFYDFPAPALTSEERRDDYVFVGEYTGSKGHQELLKAWTMLYDIGFKKTLHLTCSSSADDFIERLDKAVKAGVPIVNHGFVSREEVKALYLQSKVTIYPSFNESFGLGLVEALGCGCDVIASDRAFTYSVCKPSEVFEPSSPISIAEAVLRYEEGNAARSQQLVFDRLQDMLDKICEK